MTTDQKLAHIYNIISSVGDTKLKEVKRHYISMARGAAGAWFADMTITHEQFNAIQNTLNDLVEETI